MIPNHKIKTHLQGKAAEWRVASELALRGFTPHFPGVQNGYDLLIDGGIRIEVKSAHISYRKVYMGGAYWFKLAKTELRPSSLGQARQVSRTWTDLCDFVILFGIEESRFWILPAEIVNGCSLVVVGNRVSANGRPHVKCDVANLVADHTNGMSLRELATKYGTSTETIKRRLNDPAGESDRRSTRRAQIVREYESRWDLIDSYLSTLHEAEAAASLTDCASNLRLSGVTETRPQ